MKQRQTHTALAALSVVLAALHLPLVFWSNINWDEFRYLSIVHQHRGGALTSALQSIHVHAFGWLTAIGRNEIDQVIAARLAYYLLLVASCALIYFIARRFASVAGGLFAVVCLVSYGEIIDHATSFRFDGLAVFLLLGAVALLLAGRRLIMTISLAAMLTAAALLVTLKTVFFIPTLGLLLWFRDQDDSSRDAPRRLREWRYAARDVGVFALVFTASLALLYASHRFSLQALAVRDPSTFIREAGSRTLLPERVFPSWRYIQATVMANLVIWLIILHGVDVALHWLRIHTMRRRALLLLALLMPLLSLVVYRNAFPYFYVFIMPPAIVLCAISFDRLLEAARRGQGILSWLPVAVAAAVVGNFVAHYDVADEVQIQREVVSAVHEIFPEPVPYIDRNSMIGSFPKVGFFMSTWGFERYFDGGKPVFEQILSSEAPRFVLANHPALVLDQTVAMPVTLARYRLMEQDYEVLRDNFVPHWGPIFVAGKQLRLPPDGPVVLRMLIPGTYTVESTGALRIGHMSLEPGDVVRLEIGAYELQSLAGAQAVTLRWGHHLERPATLPPTGLLYQSL